MDEDEKLAVRKEFREAVNMSPSDLERWLETDEAKRVGAKDAPGAESVGHASGRRIVDILRKTKDDYTTRTCGRSSGMCTGTSRSGPTGT